MLAGTTVVPAIVLGTGITALGVQRLLSRAGVPSYVADWDNPLLLRSRHYRALPGLDAPDLSAPLHDWLPSVPLERAVLMPCADAWVEAIAHLGPELRQRFPSSVPPAETAASLVDKARFANVLRQWDIPHPWSLALDRLEDLDRLPTSDDSHFFLKPRDSQSFFRDFGVKAFQFASPDDARKRLRSILARGHQVIAQEYVPGPPSNHYFIDGFIDHTGRVRALLARQRLRMYPPLFGNSTYMKSVALAEAQPAADSVTRLLSALDYRGMFSAEFKRDPRDGVFRILEVNARAWWYVDFAARCGVNVVTTAYHDALGQEVPQVRDYRVGRHLVFPYSDYFACKELLRSGEMGPIAWAHSWIGAAQPVFQLRDPWPATAATVEILIGKLGKLVRRTAGPGSV